MSFLFKSSKKQQGTSLPAAARNIKSADGPPPSAPIPAAGIPPRDVRSPPPGPVTNGSPRDPATGKTSPGGLDDGIARQQAIAPTGEHNATRDRNDGDGSQSTLPSILPPMQQRIGMPPLRPAPALAPAPAVDPSPYPWSQRPLHFPVPNVIPFPRYGAAVNSVGSKDGAVYMMGGLINGSTVTGDLWMVEAANHPPACFQVSTTSEGPGPRVGHASLLVGNAFIVFGGDTKTEDSDLLDDTLYLLNTSTKQWSRAAPAGPRPPGRYGHTLNILGSKIYIFGGQVEGFFFNDLVAFDLNALQQASNRWEILIQNTIDGGPPHGQIPPARTNHTVVTWNDKLYLFGGTDGINWFNDVWSYDPRTNSWTQLECIGYIPAAREGHASALVGDVMYIFGGRTEDGNDLGDLAAFRISSRRWYTFQNMGPSPSPRSGHSMTSIGKHIVVLAGEPSTTPRDPRELSLGYYLDTSKIRYPSDSQAQPPLPVDQRIQTQRRPSADKSVIPQGRSIGNQSVNNAGSPVRANVSSPTQLGPRAAGGSAGSPQMGGLQAPTNGLQNRQPARPERPDRPDRPFSPSSEPQARPMPQGGRDLASPVPNSQDRALSPSPITNQISQSYQPPLMDDSIGSQSSTVPVIDEPIARQVVQPTEATPKSSMETPVTARQIESGQSKDRELLVDSGLGSSPDLSQLTDNLTKELESERSRNAWYASELALARKAGYSQNQANSVLDERAVDVVGDDDKPLVEAMLKMRAELYQMQSSVEGQAISAAERIAQVEKQRDVAINEAVFAKAKLAGQSSQLDAARAGTPDADRANDLSRKLAVALATHRELSNKNDALATDKSSEARARHLAEETAEAAQRRATELDLERQRNAPELESLRAELYDAQRTAREEAANSAEAVTAHKLLLVDHKDLGTKHERALADGKSNITILESLRVAITASMEKATLLEQQLNEERAGRSDMERQLTELKSQHEERTATLETTSRQLRDTEAMSQKHAAEARTHREAVLAGLDSIGSRSINNDTSATDERITVLQQQLEEANLLVRRNQTAADSASEKLRRAEERIAGLEVYQQQASREGLGTRKQLQAALKENRSLTEENTGLQQQVQSQQLETNAIAVQHGALKDLLAERGIASSDRARSRGLDSSLSQRHDTPDASRVMELEQQLQASLKSHEETKTQSDQTQRREEETRQEYEEKLTALDNDHQAAVKYLRGTEKMLSKMKQELQRVKNQAADYLKELETMRSKDASRGLDGFPQMEQERDSLRRDLERLRSEMSTSISPLETHISTLNSNLRSRDVELESLRSSHNATHADLANLQSSHLSTRADLDRLTKENSRLEMRASDAESKVQLLLDQVENSVDNYRRQSSTNPNGVNGHHRGISGASAMSMGSSVPGGFSHSRGVSLGGESVYSQGAASEVSESNTVSHATVGLETPGGRTSMALDSLANELESLRSHWETTNKNNYRLSERYDFDNRSPAKEADSVPRDHVMVDWRKGLELDDDEERASREGSLRGAGAGKGRSGRSSRSRSRSPQKMAMSPLME